MDDVHVHAQPAAREAYSEWYKRRQAEYEAEKAAKVAERVAKRVAKDAKSAANKAAWATKRAAENAAWAARRGAEQAERAKRQRAEAQHKKAQKAAAAERLEALTQQRRARWVLLVERAVEQLSDALLYDEMGAQNMLRTWPEWDAVLETLPTPGRQISYLRIGVVEAVCERREVYLYASDKPDIVVEPYGPGPAETHIWPTVPYFGSHNGCRWVGAQRFLNEWAHCVDWGSSLEGADADED